MNEPKFSYNDIIDEFCKRIQTACDKLVDELKTFEGQDLKDEKVSAKLTLLERKIAWARSEYSFKSPNLLQDNPSAVKICQDRSKEIVDEMNETVKDWFLQNHQKESENK
jgi:hypothetical protein